MDQEMRNMLALGPKQLNSQATFELGPDAAVDAVFACLDENMARASRLIEYLEGCGATFCWGYRAQDEGRSRLVVVRVTIDDDDPELQELRESIDASPLPMLANGTKYLASVLATRDIIARIRGD